MGAVVGARHALDCNLTISLLGPYSIQRSLSASFLH